MDGSIDFLCLPALRLAVGLRGARRRRARRTLPDRAAARRGAARKQLYLPDTNVLLTRFLADDGVAEISDFMPVEDAGQAHNLVRRVEDGARRGPLPDALRAALRLCARATHTVERRSDRRCSSSAGPVPASWRCGCASSVADAASRTAPPWPSSRWAPTSSASFVLEVVLTDEPSPAAQPDYESDAFKQTVNFWRRWIGAQHLPGPLARDGEPLGADAEAAHLAAARLDRRRARPSVFPRRSAARATGTIATPGSATRPSPSTG